MKTRDKKAKQQWRTKWKTNENCFSFNRNYSIFSCCAAPAFHKSKFATCADDIISSSIDVNILFSLISFNFHSIVFIGRTKERKKSSFDFCRILWRLKFVALRGRFVFIENFVPATKGKILSLGRPRRNFLLKLHDAHPKEYTEKKDKNRKKKWWFSHTWIWLSIAVWSCWRCSIACLNFQCISALFLTIEYNFREYFAALKIYFEEFFAFVARWIDNVVINLTRTNTNVKWDKEKLTRDHKKNDNIKTAIRQSSFHRIPDGRRFASSSRTYSFMARKEKSLTWCSGFFLFRALFSSTQRPRAFFRCSRVCQEEVLNVFVVFKAKLKREKEKKIRIFFFLACVFSQHVVLNR